MIVRACKDRVVGDHARIVLQPAAIFVIYPRAFFLLPRGQLVDQFLSPIMFLSLVSNRHGGIHRVLPKNWCIGSAIAKWSDCHNCKLPHRALYYATPERSRESSTALTTWELIVQQSWVNQKKPCGLPKKYMNSFKSDPQMQVA